MQWVQIRKQNIFNGAIFGINTMLLLQVLFEQQFIELKILYNINLQLFINDKPTANLVSLAQGSIVGWTAPALAILSSKSTPLSSGPLTNEQVSNVGSFNCLGGLLGSVLFGYTTSKIGCKQSLFFISFATVAFWILIYFGNVYYQILIARFISGLSGEC